MNKYTDDDWTLICRISDGDEEAMKVLVHRYWPLVFRTSLRIVCDRHEAEDISQEVFIRVWKSAGRFDRNGSITAWIYRITCNRATDILRKKKIFPSYKKKQDETSRADSETSPEERLIASEAKTADSPGCFPGTETKQTPCTVRKRKSSGISTTAYCLKSGSPENLYPQMPPHSTAETPNGKSTDTGFSMMIWCLRQLPEKSTYGRLP